MANASASEPAVTLRAASESDLATLLQLTLEGLESEELANQVTPSDAHPFHRFLLDQGRIFVAEVENQIAGYASTIDIGPARILSQLFVRGSLQSHGVGRRLFESIDPNDGRARILQASDDRRALALYIRNGYAPAWPVLAVTAAPPVLARLPNTTAVCHAIQPGLDLDHIDEAMMGARRPEIHQFWSEQGGGAPYLVRRGETTMGSVWIHDPLLGGMARWYPADCPLGVGPLTALRADDAWDCTLAALDTVRRNHPGRGAALEIPGPHPVLPPLLRAGARIDDFETAMATDVALLGDARRYIPSGGILY